MSDVLNVWQQEAVNYLHGPCLVLAGAGSGKTRVISHKIGRLIQAGLAPKHIFAITFTNKAAFEMRERTRSLVGKAARDVTICTFHALGVRLLREDGAALGLKPQFSILDSDDVVGILKDLGAGVDAACARQWQWSISRWKNQGLSADAAAAAAGSDSERQIAAVMAQYQQRLTALQAVDFDDLIGLPLQLLQQHALARQKWQGLIGHLLVDEYQDTNATQYQLLKLLLNAGGTRACCFSAVGDDDQSIYGWRGATLDNLKQLPQDFPQLKVIKLEQNYRSTSAILRAANNVIAPNPKLFVKNLWSDLGEGEPVRVIDADNEEHEAERALARIQSLRAFTGAVSAPIAGGSHSSVASVNWRDFAILYRANHQAKPFEKALRKAQIPYQVSGGSSWFERAEIKDLCAWFRLWINNQDDPAFLRAIGSPKRGIGHQTLARLGDFAASYKISLFQALSAGGLTAVLGAKTVAGLHEFGRQIIDLAQRADNTTGDQAAKQFLLDWLEDIGYEQHLQASEEKAQVATARFGNVLDFVDWMSSRCAADDEPKSLLQVAQTVSLLSTISEREKDQNTVTLSTLHAAKGLEWPHVMLVGVNEGMLPFKLRDNPQEAAPAADSNNPPVTAEDPNLIAHLEEERRLMYVGITRAQRSLSISWTRKRKKGREMVSAQPSRFIADMQLEQSSVRADPRAKLKALRDKLAQQAAARAVLD